MNTFNRIVNWLTWFSIGILVGVIFKMLWLFA